MTADIEVQIPLSEQAHIAYEQSKREIALALERAREGSDDERRIALALALRDSLGISIDAGKVFVPSGPQSFLNAVVDVDDVTLANVGYIGAQKLYVLFRCEQCGVIRQSLAAAGSLALLGRILADRRPYESCNCRPGHERWITGGVRPR